MSLASILMLCGAFIFVTTAASLWFAVRSILLNDAACLVFAERQRQLTDEGWTREHDDEHARGEMAAAAACYAMPPDIREELLPGSAMTLGFVVWPWGVKWWSPTPDNRVRELTKAGALILAEIDRELRAQKRAAKGGRS